MATQFSQIIKFGKKTLSIPDNQFNAYYHYGRQSDYPSLKYKTFKTGEIYRFGIQFQDAKGAWSDVAWIGDVEQTIYPKYENGVLEVSTAKLDINDTDVSTYWNPIKTQALSEGYKNYRLLMADPRFSNGRKVLAQGILCPTVFSSTQRLNNDIYAIPSWIMRPKDGKLSYHHLEPITSPLAFDDSAEIQIDNSTKVGNDNYYKTVDKGIDVNNNSSCYVSLLCVGGGKVFYALYRISGTSVGYFKTNFYKEYIDSNGIPQRVSQLNSSNCKLIYGAYYTGGGFTNIRNDIRTEVVKAFLIERNEAAVTPVQNYVPDSTAISGYEVSNSEYAFDSSFPTVTELEKLNGAKTVTKVKPVEDIIRASFNSAVPKGLDVTDDNNKMEGVFVKLASRNWCKWATLEYHYDRLINDYYDKLIIWRGSGNNNLTLSNIVNSTFKVHNDYYHFFSDVPIYDETPYKLKTYSYYNANTSQYEEADEHRTSHYLPTYRFTLPTSLNLPVIKKSPVVGGTSFTVSDTTTVVLVNSLLNITNLSSTASTNAENVLLDKTKPGQGIWSDNSPESGIEVAFKNELKNKSVLVQTVNPGSFTSSKRSYNYFVDNSIVTFHSPDVVENPYITKNRNIKLKIVGLAPIQNSYSDIQAEFSVGPYLEHAGFNTYNIDNYRNADVYNPLVNDFFIIDAAWAHNESSGGSSDDNNYNDVYNLQLNTSEYKLFMWNHDGSAIGATSFDRIPSKVYVENEDNFEYASPYNTIKKKTFFNHNFSYGNYYWENEQDKEGFNLFNPDFVEYSDNSSVLINRNKGTSYGLDSVYKGNYDNIIASDRIPIIHRMFGSSSSDLVEKPVMGSVRIKFDSTPHVVLGLGKSAGKYYILPRMAWESIGYSKDYRTTSMAPPDYRYPCKKKVTDSWGDSNYTKTEAPEYDDYIQDAKRIFSSNENYNSFIASGSSDINPSDLKPSESPYLYIAELQQDIDNDELYGGTSALDLKKLVWIPISKITPLTEGVDETEGDTYYQRWDCLKTYPTTEDDLNKVVDITSFMVESRINLDERTDPNRANFNIMSRPSNFNLFNPVYSQLNNLFSYSITDGENATEEYPTQFTWSLTKNFNALVDSWTNVSLVSLGNCRYPITKLVTFGQNILALTQHNIEHIMFNARTMIPTEGFGSIEVANSSKVTGTVALNHPYGTYNMSALITEQGLYFVDDNEKSIIRIGNDLSIKKIAALRMDSWLKNNIVQGTYTPSTNTQPFHLEYDNIHKDIYIVNDTYCLVYNETLDSFTSFMDYERMKLLYCFNGKTYAIAKRINTEIINTVSSIKHVLNYTYEMFGGNYNEGFFVDTSYDDIDNVPPLTQKPLNYSVEYRVNNKPLEDKVFTNIEFISDRTSNGMLNSPASGNTGNPIIQQDLLADQPFDLIRATNEYQDTGDVTLNFLRNNPSNLSQKFRIWRADIPRDGNKTLAGNRIRNPWIHLKLQRTNGSGNTLGNKLTTLHSIIVQYLR